MKALIDTNVILDTFISREAFKYEAEDILFLSAQKKIDAFFTTNAFVDLFYLGRKIIPDDHIRSLLKVLVHLFTLIPITDIDCAKALASPLSDLEDAVMCECAHRVGIDYVVTRDKMISSGVYRFEIISPKDFLQLIET